MAWQSGLAGDAALYRNHVIPAADFLVAHGPSDGVERWEEQTGYSPSTISAEIAGLTAAVAHRARSTTTRRTPGSTRPSADEFARKIKDWTVTTTGPYAPRRTSSALSKTGDPNAGDHATASATAASPPTSARSSTPGFLELVRLGDPAGERPRRPGVADGHRQRDRAPDADRPRVLPLRHERDRQRGRLRRLLRARRDELLARPAQPWPPTDHGSGPPVAGARRASAANTTSPAATAPARPTLLSAMRAMTSGQGLEPEQAWEDPDARAPRRSAPIRRPPRSASPPVTRPARPARSPGRSRSTRG